MRLGERAADAGHASEQRGARGVELHADAVHAALDHLVELLRQHGLKDVVLVLADPDALGIDLHELGRGILQAPGDADRAAHREVEVRELFARDVARRVHAGAGLADRRRRREAFALLVRPASVSKSRHERFGFATVRAIAHGHRRRSGTLAAAPAAYLGARRASAASPCTR